MPGEVNLTATLNNSAARALNTNQLVYVLLEASPTGAGVPTQMPLNFGLVLDRSGSMAGAKIKQLREAVKLLLGKMSAQDLVSIIVFDDKVDTLVSNQPVTDLKRLHAQVDKIGDRGGTTMSLGMRRGLDELKKGLRPDRVSRMVLLTDGETYGDEEACKNIATESGRLGVGITAFGLGEDWNSALLDTIAENSGGVDDYLDAPDKILIEFQRTLRAMQGTVVKNAALTLRLVAGVTPRAAWRVVPQISKLSARTLSDRDVQIPLGDVDRDTGQAVLVELVVQPKTPGAYRIAQAELTYDVPAAGLSGERVRQDVILNLVDSQAVTPPPDPRLMNLVEKVSVFKLQTQALDAAQAGDITRATQQLRAAATRLLNLGEADLAQAAEAEAGKLEHGEKMSAAGTKKLQYGTRKLTQRLDEDGNVI
jgi:Ca-activated chloride channel family protein